MGSYCALLIFMVHLLLLKGVVRKTPTQDSYMKKDIHPEYYPASVVVCACGNKLKVGSTLEKFDVEICSACHPFYTGEEKIVDTAGRVEKFKKRQEAAAAAKKKPAKKKK